MYAGFRPEFQESPILRPFVILRTFPVRMTSASDPEATGGGVDTVDDHGPDLDPARGTSTARALRSRVDPIIQSTIGTSSRCRSFMSGPEVRPLSTTTR